MKILVTGFDPFGEDSINPSEEIVKSLDDTINGATIIKLIIPTVMEKSAEVVKEAIVKHNPNVVINIGQAGNRFNITPELIAINLDDARIPDNEGNQPISQKIKIDGQNAYFTQLPIKAMVSAMQSEGIPSEVSRTAGTFVCNHIMYQVQYLIDKEFKDLSGGFIHVPYIPKQVVNKPNTPYMNLDDMIRGITVCISTIIDFYGKPDLKVIGGAIS